MMNFSSVNTTAFRCFLHIHKEFLILLYLVIKIVGLDLEFGLNHPHPKLPLISFLFNTRITS